jgi:hypothetical protein
MKTPMHFTEFMTECFTCRAFGPLPVAGQPDTFDPVISAPPSPSHFYFLYLSLL